MTVIERFLKFVSFDTTSSETSGQQPSTPNQKVLGGELVRQMLALGICDAHMDDAGYVYGTIPANCAKDLPVYGLIAHMDTSPDAPGGPIHARITEAYDGGDIVLNEAQGIVLSPRDYASLQKHVGKRLIVTDGTTLLGADDKAGVAEILSAAEKLLTSDRPHGTVKIAFTPDEEIGEGADRFDVTGFGADYAYTVDGGAIGELEYENFNAASARFEVQGKNIHPGSAKDKMLNALQVVCEINAMLPPVQRPEHTEGYEGFYHLVGIGGSVEAAESSYIIRDHDRAKFERKKAFAQEVADFLNRKYGEGTVKLTLKDQYYNMREMVEPHPQVIAKAEQAMRMAGVEPLVKPIRGGTDGSRLSYMGLPCPNLFTGGMNFHGKYEYASLDTMKKAMQTIINLAGLWAE